MTIAEQLRQCRWFGRCDPAVQQAIAADGRLVTLARGQWVYGEGDMATGIVIVLDGMLRLEAAAGEKTVLVGIARAGDAFGQSRQMGGGPRIVTAIASRPSRVLTISDTMLDRIGHRLPALWKATSELVYGQLDASVHGLAQMLSLRPRGRIAARLLTFARDADVPLSQSDLAELCGLSRKVVSAHLAALEQAGAIRRGYRTIHLRDMAQLSRLAGDADGFVKAMERSGIAHRVSASDDSILLAAGP
ncbi:Crp/Fnr family transcriptional regulator [Sphingopyxis terrae]|uniref:Crp/Fnr family transcriptional regulator n=1 Tax=Sphingopyxis terrae TaxID=33052 RepID=UPI000788870B|nr:Crp/Fnr family transcriptional regulator [Sphingopyxis terrae]